MDASALSQLSPDQIASLNDQQKAIYCTLSPADQAFFSETFSPRDLPTVLDRKGEILQRNQAMRERIQRLQAQFAANPRAGLSSEALNPTEIVTAVAGAVGIGVVAHTVATDHTAHWQGVEPKALIGPLRAEFEDKQQTDISFDGSPDALEGTVFLVSSGRPIPALTINLTRIENGVEVEVSDLTAQGTLETLRKGGEKLLSLAGKGLLLWTRRNRGFLNPLDWMNNANSVLTDAAGAAEVVSNLKLEDRAWQVIKNTAESNEKAYLDHQRLERETRSTIERAWDEYNACPTCAVPFGAEDETCRVCGTARPPMPTSPDPRQV